MKFSFKKKEPLPDGKMTYIFLSATRPKYRKNVLNTLYLPSGLAATYRYQLLGQRTNLPANIVTQVNARTSREVCLVFVDRYAEKSYSYAVIRLGEMLKAETSEDRGFFHVELGQHVFAPPGKELHEWLTNNLPNLPKLNKTPENFDDGHYVLVGPTLPQNLVAYTGEEGWNHACDHISGTKFFRDNGDYPVFLRATTQLKEANGQDSGLLRALVAPRGGSIAISISSRLPEFTTRYSNLDAKLELTASAGLLVRTNGFLDVSGPADRRDFLIEVDVPGHLKSADLSMKRVSAAVGEDQVTLVLPDQHLLIEPRTGYQRGTILALLALAFAVGQFLSAFGGFSFGVGVEMTADQIEAAGKGIGAVLSSVGLMGLLWMLHRRIA